MLCNITYSSTNDYTFVRVPKAATRSTLAALHSYTEVDIGKPLKYCRYADEEGYRVPWGAPYSESGFIFTFVRNPWARLVSVWREKKRKPNFFRYCAFDRSDFDTFSKFAKKVCSSDKNLYADQHWQPQVSLVPFDDMHFIGRQETFVRDLRHVGKEIGTPICHVPDLNMYNKNKDHYSIHYTPELCDMVANAYSEDIKRLQYKYDEIPGTSYFA
jgi:hypothetical protein